MNQSRPTAKTYRRALAAANEKYGWAEVPDCPIEIFAQILGEREQQHPEATLQQTQEIRMRWYKHLSDFRTSPGMKYIQQELGDYGIAGVYRLYELFAQRFGVNDDFSGSILLSPPFTDRWLAQEILTPCLSDEQVQEPYRDLNEVPIAQLNKFLSVCTSAGLLEIEFIKGPAHIVQADGSKKDVEEPSTWRKLIIPGFAALKDDWSGRKKTSRALSTPE